MTEPLPLPDESLDGQSDEPLGIKSPLLPAEPLGQTVIRRQFLVPLGARPIAILDPSIFLQRSIDDFPIDLFQESTFFPEPSDPVTSSIVPQQANRSPQSSVGSVDSAIQPKLDELLESNEIQSASQESYPHTQHSATNWLDATIQPKLEESLESADIQPTSTVTHESIETQGKISEATSITPTQSFIQRAHESDPTIFTHSLEETDFIQSDASIVSGDAMPSAQGHVTAQSPHSSRVTSQTQLEYSGAEADLTLVQLSSDVSEQTSSEGLFEKDRSSHQPAPDWKLGLTEQSPLKGLKDYCDESQPVSTDFAPLAPNSIPGRDSNESEETFNPSQTPSKIITTNNSNNKEFNQKNDLQSIAASENAEILAQRNIETSSSQVKEATEISAELNLESVTSSQNTDVQGSTMLDATRNFFVQPFSNQVELISEPTNLFENKDLQDSDVKAASDSLVQPSFDRVSLQTNVESAIASQSKDTAILQSSQSSSVASFSNPTPTLNPASAVSSQSTDVQNLILLETSSNALVQPSSILTPSNSQPAPAQSTDVQSATVLEVSPNSLVQPFFDPVSSETIAESTLASENVDTVSVDVLANANTSPTPPSFNQISLESSPKTASSPQNADVQSTVEASSRSFVQPSFGLATSESNTELAPTFELLDVDAAGSKMTNAPLIESSSTSTSLESNPAFCSQNTDTQSATVSEISASSLIQPSLDRATLEINTESAIVSDTVNIDNFEVSSSSLAQSPFTQVSRETDSEPATFQHSAIDDVAVSESSSPSVQPFSDPALLDSPESTIAPQGSDVADSAISEASRNFLVEAISNQALLKSSTETVISRNIENEAAQEATRNSFVQPSFELDTSEAIAETEIADHALESSEANDFQNVAVGDTSVLEIPSTSLEESNSKSAFSPQAIDAINITTSGTSLLQPFFEQILPESDTEITSSSQNVDDQNAAILEAANSFLVQLSPNQVSSELNPNGVDSSQNLETQRPVTLERSSASLIQPSFQQTALEANPELTIAPQNPNIENAATSEITSSVLAQPFFDQDSLELNAAPQSIELENSVALETANLLSAQPSFEQISPELNAESAIAPQTAEVENPAVLETTNLLSAQPSFERDSAEADIESAGAFQTIETENPAVLEISPLTVEPSSNQVLAESNAESTIAPQNIEIENSSVLETTSSPLAQPSFDQASSKLSAETAIASQKEEIENRAISETPRTSLVQPSSLNLSDANTQSTTGLEAFDNAPIQQYSDLAASESNIELVPTPQPESTTVLETTHSSLIQPSLDQVLPELHPMSSSQDIDVQRATVSEASNHSLIQPVSGLAPSEVSSNSAIVSENINTDSAAGLETTSNSLVQPPSNQVLPELKSEFVTFSQNLAISEGSSASPIQPSFERSASETIPVSNITSQINTENLTVIEGTNDSQVQRSSKLASSEGSGSTLLSPHLDTQNLAAPETSSTSPTQSFFDRSSIESSSTSSQKAGAESLIVSELANSPLVQASSDRVSLEANNEPASNFQTTSMNNKVLSDVTQDFSIQLSPNAASESNTAESVCFSKNTDAESLTATNALGNSFTSPSSELVQSNPKFTDSSQTVDGVTVVEAASTSLIQPSSDLASLETNTQSTVFSQNAEGTVASSETLIQAAFDPVLPELSMESTHCIGTKDITIAEVSSNALVRSSPNLPSERSNVEIEDSTMESFSTPSIQASVNQVLSESNSETAIASQETDATDLARLEASSDFLVQASSSQVLPEVNAESIIAPENIDVRNLDALEAPSNSLVQASFDQILPELSSEPTTTSQDANVGSLATSDSSVQSFTNSGSLESNNESANLQNINNPLIQPLSARLLPDLESAIAPSKTKVESLPISQVFNEPLVQPSLDQVPPDSNTESTSSPQITAPENSAMSKAPSNASSFDLITSTEPTESLLTQPSNLENVAQSHSSLSHSKQPTTENSSAVPDSQINPETLPSLAPEIQLFSSSVTTPALPQVLQNISVLQPLTETPVHSTDPPVDFETSLAVIRRASDAKSHTTSSVHPTRTASEWKPVVSQKSTSTIQRSQATSSMQIENQAIATSPTIQTKYNFESEPIKKTSQFKSTTDDQGDSANSEQIETLAQAVYHQLKQRLRIDQERHGRNYSGRLPW